MKFLVHLPFEESWVHTKYLVSTYFLFKLFWFALDYDFIFLGEGQFSLSVISVDIFSSSVKFYYILHFKN